MRPSFPDWTFLLCIRDKMIEDKGTAVYVGTWG